MVWPAYTLFLSAFGVPGDCASNVCLPATFEMRNRFTLFPHLSLSRNRGGRPFFLPGTVLRDPRRATLSTRAAPLLLEVAAVISNLQRSPTRTQRAMVWLVVH